MMTLEGTKAPQIANERNVRQWVDAGKSPADFFCSILVAVDDIHILLIPLLLAFGGAAKLAPFVSIAKNIQVIRRKVKQLQHSMLTSWLNSNISVDDVFDMLELSDLRKRGYTYENLDTYAQFIGGYNK